MERREITTSDVGVPIKINIGEDISDFTTFELILKDPDDVVTVVTCSLDPDNNCIMELTPTIETFAVVGAWIAQPKLSTDEAVFYGKEFEFDITLSIE